MNLTEMRTDLRSQIGNPTTVDVADIELDRHINSAYIEIADTFRFHTVRKLCRFTTVADTKRYGIPTDCLAVLKARDLTNEQILEKFGDRRAFQEKDLATSGHPVSYSRFRDWIELHPAPDDEYEVEIYYKANVTALVGDSETPGIPVPWHRGIIKLAKYNYYDTQGDQPKAIAAHNAYTVWLQTKPIELDEEKVDFDSGVGVPTLSDPMPKNLDFDHSP